MEGENLQLASALEQALRDRDAAEDTKIELEKRLDSLSRKYAAEKDELKKCTQQYQESEVKLAELKALVHHMEASTRTLQERNQRVSTAVERK